ncbi:tRNA dihydrouridine synthase DusA [Picosynechococcus sp. PCC 8807]|uniref:tRNA dihydrouridine(20/20a) synthase DusA n=2 Tax=Picosynechococcus sp. PCC 8807 TaxID=195248 RepID=UPI0008106C1E|nr:tRNA dihydrouridine(20/20a) synthase DusA [Picosynechococcus sp. PCC 8807]ANV89833.1 tRNA dihydrouridine synthase DusA [Picosynechococcus sp. PCC 8807]
MSQRINAVVCPHLLSVAPMMDRTDRHFRYLMRQITRRTLLYTEMITTQAIIHGDRPKLLDFDAAEHPISLQLGGDNPKELAECAKVGEDWGYDEINLNVGCPSPRVQQGNFGACLMTQPELVADCVAAMQGAVNIPVTVKHRIGVDEQDSYADLCRFIEIVSATGCNRFSVHARKAWLQGLSPKENRTVPPLRYADVYRLKQDFPHLWIEINGGITALEQIQTHLTQVDAVMVGRAAYDNPYLFATVDRDIYGEAIQPKSRHEIVEEMLPYIERATKAGVKLHSISRHMLSLFLGQPGTKAWKRFITEEGRGTTVGREIIEQALALVPQTNAIADPVSMVSGRK